MPLLHQTADALPSRACDDQANNAVVVDKPTYDKIIKEVPTYKVISQSVLIDRHKGAFLCLQMTSPVLSSCLLTCFSPPVNGSVARAAIKYLEKEGLIKRIIHHRAQQLYTRATAVAE